METTGVLLLARAVGAIAAVVPILPPFFALSIIVSVLLASLLAAFASWRRPGTVKNTLHMFWRLKVVLACFVVLAAAALWSMGWLIEHFISSGHHGGVGLSRGNERSQFTSQNTGQYTGQVIEPWPTARGGLMRRGALPGAEGPSQGGKAWTFGRRQSFYASPAPSGDWVLAIGCRKNRAAVFALHAATGELAWSAAPPNFRATFSSPVLADGFLLCGEGLHHTKDARLICIDLRPGNVGQIAWTFRTNSHIECTPVVDNGRVYFGAGDDGVYCLEWGGEPSRASAASNNNTPKVRWRLPPDRYPDAETALAVHQGRVYLGLGVGGQALCVLDADTGREIKRIAAPYPIFSPPAIHQHKLYVGLGGGDYVHPQDGRHGAVWCVDLDSLQVDWTFAVEGTVLGACAVTDDRVMFGCADGNVYALDLQGRLKRRFDTGAPIANSPVITKNRVYVVNAAGMLYGLDSRWLTPVWEHRLAPPSEKGVFVSSPIVAGGHIYVGTESGFLCVGQPARERVAAVWPSPWGGAGMGGCRDGSTIPLTGEVLWKYPAEGTATTIRDSSNDSDITPAPAAAANDVVVAPLALSKRKGVVCVAFTPDRTTIGAVRWFAQTRHGVFASPVIASGFVFAVDGREGDSGRTLTCWRIADGKNIWRLPVAASASGVLAVQQEMLLVQDRRLSLSCYRLDKSLVWRKKMGTIQQPPAAGTARVAVAVTQPPSLAILDLPTGATLWQVPLEGPPTTTPAVREEKIYLGGTTGLEVRSVLDGHRMHHWQIGGVTPPLYVDRQRFAFVNSRSEFILGRVRGGAIIAKRKDMARGAALITSSTALLPTSDGMVRLTFHPHHVTEEAWPKDKIDRMKGPAVLHQGLVFLNDTDQGLVCLGGM